MAILETGDTALVLARTLVSAKNRPVIEPRPRTVFRMRRRVAGFAPIDNSYGTRS
jgi:hypothetical protein